ncbi:MAG: hypothetical protein Q4E36_00370 [Bacillota bacterium]|nr:hypothetical protein [Bacillota bacterium]
MKKQLSYMRVDPAGNITGFVLSPVDPKDRARIAEAIIKDYDPSVEQVGFISENPDGSHRMDMMGGEFCGNASRSFGLYLASLHDLKADQSLDLHVSGSQEPVNVRTNLENMTAEITLNPAYKVEKLRLAGKTYTTVFLPGIIHVLVDDREEDQDFVRDLLEDLKKIQDEEAYGIMFINKDQLSMVPYVYVKETATLIREGSCGSGTVAAGYFLNENKDPSFKAILKEPGGSLQVSYQEKDGKITYAIGGPVVFGPKEEIEIDL